MYKVYNTRTVERKLRAAGFQLVRQHPQKKYVKETIHGRRTVKVPCHRDVPAGRLKRIIEQAGLTPDEFERL